MPLSNENSDRNFTHSTLCVLSRSDMVRDQSTSRHLKLLAKVPWWSDAITRNHSGRARAGATKSSEARPTRPATEVLGVSEAAGTSCDAPKCCKWPLPTSPRLSGNVSQGLSTRGMCAHMPVLARPSAPQTLSPRHGSSSAQQRAPVSSWFNTGWAAADRRYLMDPRFDHSGRA